MITRLRIDNYKMFQNADITFGSQNLIMGANGTGKTSVFEIVNLLKRLLVDGEICEDLFEVKTVPRWLQNSKRVLQTFVLEMEGPLGPFTYQLTVEQLPQEQTSRIYTETLHQGDHLLFNCERGTVQILDESSGKYAPEYQLTLDRSAMSLVPAHPIYNKLTWFKQRLSRTYYFQIDARKMNIRSQRADQRPSPDLENFASWYEYAIKNEPGEIAPYLQSLENIISGFQSLKLRDLGQGTSILEARFSRASSDDSPSTPSSYVLGLNELSDGQRALIALNAIAKFLLQPDSTICIDEPDNFVAISEVQPILSDLLDRAQEQNAQLLLISHHPESLNLLATEHGLLFRRSEDGTARVQPFQADPDTLLTPAEYIAQGWDNA